MPYVLGSFECDGDRLVDGKNKIRSKLGSIDNELESADPRGNGHYGDDIFGGRSRGYQLCIPHTGVDRDHFGFDGGTRGPEDISRTVGTIGPIRVNVEASSHGPFELFGLGIDQQPLWHATSSEASDQHGSRLGRGVWC